MPKFWAILFVLTVQFSHTHPPFAQLSPQETRMVATVDAEYEWSVALLERLVNQNSGTKNIAGVCAVADIMRDELELLGFKLDWQDMTAAGRAGTVSRKSLLHRSGHSFTF